MIPTNRQIHAKLEIIRPSGRVDVTPYLESAEVELGSIEDLGTGTGADIGVHTLTFSLRNDGQRVQYWDTDTLLGDSEKVLGDTEGGVDLTAIIGAGKWARHSFAPRDKQSDWNVVAGEWEPLLWPYRGVVFQVAVTAPGMAPNNWITLFEGYLGDNITTEPHRVTVRCRDKSKRLQDAYIDTPKTYTGPMAAETLIQAIINDYVENPPQLYCPVASGITFDEMKVEYVSVWDAIQNVAKQMGWFLGYRWNGTSYALTFIEPPRSKDVADFHFDWEDDFYQESLDIGDADIRNALTLSYRDKETGERVTLSYRDFPQLKNQESIDEYGKRAMQIEEADTSLIDTQDKALAFGEMCIWDLSELNATDRLVLPLFPWLDIFSTFTVANPLISSTTDFYAVQNIRHSLRFGEDARFQTEVIATTRVVGAKRKWLDMETRPGSPGDPKKQGPPGPPGEDGYTPPIPADPVWGSYTLTSALHLTWHKAEHATDYEIREDLNWGNGQGMVFRGYAHSLSIIPRDRELILYLRALNVAGEYSDNYATLEVSLPAPPPPQQPEVEAFFSALKIRPVPLNLPSVMGYYVYVTGQDIDDKIAVIAGADLTYPAPSGTTVTIQVAAYDILGEGGKSEPLQATTTHLDRADFPEWVKQPLDNIAEQWVTETDESGNIIGLVKVEDGARDGHIAILADAFSIATPEGRKQIFVFDTQDRKLYLVGDLVAEGLIRATELQAEVAKALLMQAELGVFDEIHGLRIRADKITVGGGAPGLVTAKPSNSRLWHFDTSLQSTCGIKPLDGAVATLRPGEGKFGGAVAVEEGTTNQIFVAGYQSWFANLNVGDSTDRSVGGGTIRVTRLGEHRYRAEVIADCTYPILSLTNTFTWPANQPHTMSAYILDYYEAPGTTGRLGLGRSSSGNPSLHGADGLGRKTYTSQGTSNINAPFAVRGAGNALIKAGTYIEWEFAQVELNKPFATSFVDGTRPDGILAYPIALKDDYTIACYRKSHTDEDYKHVVKLSDGTVYVDGVEDSEYDVGWIAGSDDCLMFSNQTGLIDELLILPYAATDAEIKAWYGMGAPFYDPAGNIVYEGAGGRIEMDKDGMRFIRKADNEVTLQMDIETGSAYFGGELAAKSIKAEWFEEIRNVLPYTGLDSLDPSNPIDYDFYIPSEATNIISVKLSAMGLPFRGYSKSVASDSSKSSTSDYWSWSSQTTSGDGSHSHRFSGSSGNTDPAGYHTHTVSFPSHRHDFTIPSHSHDMVYGIYTGSTPQNVQLYCDDGNGWGPAISLGSTSNLATELDITDQFSGPGWKRIRFTSTRMGRITWQLVVKVDLTA